MKELYQKYKKEIGIGVIVSLITTAVLEAGDWMIAVVPFVGISIFETATNIVFSLAATNADTILFSLIIWVSLGLFTGFITPKIIDGVKIYKWAFFAEKTVKKNLSENASEEDILKILDIDTKNELKQKSIFEEIKNKKRYGRRAIFLFICVVFLAFLFMFYVCTPMSMHSEFERDVIKIAPYVEENVITLLKSNWVCMRSKSDYEAIYEIISDIEERYSLPT